MPLVMVLCAFLISAPQTFPKTALKPALKEAKKLNRLILAEFWTFNTEPSRSYAERVLSDPAILRWLSRNAVGARVNVDFNKTLRERFFVKKVPCLLLLDTDLHIWARIEGPKRPEQILKVLNQALSEKKAFEQAESDLKRNPNDIEALLKRFRGFLRREEGKNAEAVLKRLRSLDPESKKVPYGRLAFELAARVYEPRKQVDAAIRLYSEAARWAAGRKPSLRCDSLFRAANLKLFQKEFETAAKLLELLLKEFKRFPDRSKAMYTLGLIYVRHLKQIERGREILEKVRDGYADRFALAAEKLLDLIDRGQVEAIR